VNLTRQSGLITRRTGLAALAAGALWVSPANAEGDLASRTLRVALSSPPGPLDPAAAAAPEQLAPVFSTYQQMVSPTGEPELARRWRADATGLVWTFEIEAGRRFSDGTPVDAAAVVFSLNRLARLGRGPASDFVSFVEDVAAPAPMSVRLTLRQPTPRLLSILADRAASIVNPSVAAHAIGEDLGSGWLATRTAGTGPYALSPASASGAFVLERNPFYAGAPPYFSRIIFTVIADPTVRALALQRGEIDVALLMPAQALKVLARDSAVRVVSQPAYAFQNLAFNLARPVFRDVRLREAVAHAIDTQAIVTHIREGRASRFDGPLAPDMLGARPGDWAFRYDPARAAALAQEAGRTQPVNVVMIYPGVSPETDSVAQYIQAMLAPLKLNVRLERLSTAAYLDRMDRGAYDLVLMGWVCSNSDPSAILDFWFEGAKAGVSNPARYSDEEVSRLLAAARIELDPSRRAELHRAIIARVNADIPYVYLQQTHVSAALRADIAGFSMDPARSIDLPLVSMRRAS
jgi:peptide/nickel transport system substrate-binding protein